MYAVLYISLVYLKLNKNVKTWFLKDSSYQFIVWRKSTFCSLNVVKQRVDIIFPVFKRHMISTIQLKLLFLILLIFMHIQSLTNPFPLFLYFSINCIFCSCCLSLFSYNDVKQSPLFHHYLLLDFQTHKV